MLRKQEVLPGLEATDFAELQNETCRTHGFNHSNMEKALALVCLKQQGAGCLLEMLGPTLAARSRSNHLGPVELPQALK